MMVRIERPSVEVISVDERDARLLALKWLSDIIGDRRIEGTRLIESDQHPHNGADMDIDKGEITDPKNHHIVRAIQIRQAIQEICYTGRPHRMYKTRCSDCGREE